MPNPPFQVRGVVEGFYGEPWTHENRLKAAEIFPTFGFNTYVIAPKDDPAQRNRWREPLAGERMIQTAELIKRGRNNGLDMAMAVSPGLSVQYSSIADRESVLQRFLQQSQWGTTLFVLLWDDIDWDLQFAEDIERYEYIEDAQADFSNWIHTQLLTNDSKSRLMVCPMIYNGRGKNSYIARLGEKLNSEIDLMWTGREIRSPYIDSVDAEVFTSDAGRLPLYWDNFPVNNLSMRFELHMGSIVGRQPELSLTSRGLLSNPMNQFECSLLPLFTVGEFLSDPDTYNPEEAWNEGFTLLFGEEELSTELRRFFRTVMSSPINSDAAPDFRKQLNEGISLFRKGDRLGAAGEIRKLASQIIQDGDRLINHENPSDVLIEVKSWLPKYLLGGQTLSALAEYVSKPSSANRDELQKWVEKLDANRYIVFGDVLDGVVDEILRFDSGSEG